MLTLVYLVNLVGPMPSSQGFTHLLTMVDRRTRWPKAVTLASMTTADVTQAFTDTRVAHFGTSSDICSGPQFTSELRTEVVRILGVQLQHTTSFHPQANGLCEHFHRSLKTALKASLTDDRWVEWLAWVLLGLRTAPRRIHKLPRQSWCMVRLCRFDSREHKALESIF